MDESASDALINGRGIIVVDLIAIRDPYEEEGCITPARSGPPMGKSCVDGRIDRGLDSGYQFIGGFETHGDAD